LKVDRHAPRFIELGGGGPEIWAHMLAGPFDTVDYFKSIFANDVAPGPAVFHYAILDLTKPADDSGEEGGAFAGVLSYTDASPANLSLEIGILVLPPFQRTHVTSNAVGLGVLQALTPKSEGGFGLTRVLWQTSTANKGSIKVAERMGFRLEGTLKYHRQFKDGKLNGKVGNGRPSPPGCSENDLWRDTLILSLCWDDWDENAREKVQAAMDRTR